ncbi:hypothetical protein [Peribacillus muralis]|uniref:hypothetical protein n=1 Tax=Peribacillus muralis TaxID=264697 RepID=UPI003D2A03A6
MPRISVSLNNDRFIALQALPFRGRSLSHLGFQPAGLKWTRISRRSLAAFRFIPLYVKMYFESCLITGLEDMDIDRCFTFQALAYPEEVGENDELHFGS